MRTYSELIQIKDFVDRIRYLKLEGSVGNRTFGGSRPLNQILYTSPEWRSIRRKVILRDKGLDLAHSDHPIESRIYVHHIEPIEDTDIIYRTSKIFDLENLISASFDTHQIIHWGNIEDIIQSEIVERKPYDTCPWKGV